MPRESGRAAPMSPEARRQAIIEAVAPVVLERGPDLTTREIATVAGVAEGTLFRVFADKREILLATCWHVMRPEAARDWLGEADATSTLEETLRQVVTTMVDGVERMGRVLMAARSLGADHLRGHLHQPAHGAPGHRPAPRPPQDFFEESNRQVLARLADRLRPYGDALAVEPERAALMIRALVLGSVHPGIGAEQQPTPEEITALLLSGIAAPAAAEKGES